jgi:hypothetical protein
VYNLIKKKGKIKMKITKLAPPGVTKFVNRALLKARKYSPEAAIVGGVIVGGVAIVAFCNAARHTDEVLDRHEEAMDRLNQEKPIDAEHPDSKDVARVYARTGVDLAKLYGPAFGLEALSIGLFLSSYGILKKRNIGILAAYNAVESAFGEYRKRVADELGEDREEEFHLGSSMGLVKHLETDENGEEKEEVTMERIFNNLPGSPYVKDFNAFTSDQWGSPDYNMMFLKAQQNFANDLLVRNGHLFLNEVFDALGLERTKEGAVTGWVRGHGDSYVDFGISEGFYEEYELDSDVAKKNIRLCFNVDGVILDLI